MEALRVVAAAILKLDGDEIVSLPPPARHHDLITLLTKRDGVYDWRNEQGFLLSDGQFARRAPALIIAREAGQIVARCGGDQTRLYSENLW